MQPNQKQYDSLDMEVMNPSLYSSRFQTRDPMKLSDIEGATPAQIPGYTGTKVHKMLARNGSMPNFGPTKAEINSQWK